MTETALLAEPTTVFVYLSGLLALVYALAGIPALGRLFEVTPPILYAYMLPMASTTLGVERPESSFKALPISRSFSET